jgi:hypothetical protein
MNGLRPRGKPRREPAKAKTAFNLPRRNGRVGSAEQKRGMAPDASEKSAPCGAINLEQTTRTIPNAYNFRLAEQQQWK